MSGCLRILRTGVFSIAGGARTSVPRVVFVFTNGPSNVDAALTTQEAVELKFTGLFPLGRVSGEWAFEASLWCVVGRNYEVYAACL